DVLAERLEVGQDFAEAEVGLVEQVLPVVLAQHVGGLPLDAQGEQGRDRRDDQDGADEEAEGDLLVETHRGPRARASGGGSARGRRALALLPPGAAGRRCAPSASPAAGGSYP